MNLSPGDLKLRMRFLSHGICWPFLVVLMGCTSGFQSGTESTTTGMTATGTSAPTPAPMATSTPAPTAPAPPSTSVPTSASTPAPTAPTPTSTPAPTSTPTPAPAPLPTTAACNPSANDAAVTSVGLTLCDSAHNVWQISASGQVEVNGVIDTRTVNVIEISLINGVLWQENATLDWFSTTGPNEAWVGSTVSPVPTPTSGTPVSTKTTTIGDDQAFTVGSYLAFISPFNKGSNVYGTNYTESMTIADSSFPNQTVLTWSWPNVPCPQGIYVFSAIDFGYYDDTVVQNPIPSTTVNNIQTLIESHSLTFSGMLQGFDAIDDFFLTTSPEDSNTLAAEIEVFLHTPTYAAYYVQSSTPIGTFQGSGITWTVTLSHGGSSGLDLLFMPSNQADVPSGTIDLKAMLDYLVSKGVISGNLYFNGLALGTETQQGSGSMVVNSFSVTYK